MNHWSRFPVCPAQSRRIWTLGLDDVSGEISLGCFYDVAPATAVGELARASSALDWLLGVFMSRARGVECRCCSAAAAILLKLRCNLVEAWL